ncbi:hypothetical protein [Rufibacter sp. LB8]|uniref:hypothetical protein n=1 Tax=Rufibacter sp. LB8 TaxID=2777781 RepID=UPI00178C2795|nr:hypothetical protein [Rufibacter sp. LB8]
MRFTKLKLLRLLIPGIFCLGIHGCQTNVPEEKVRTMTFITLGAADSTTKENHGFGVARFVYIDFNKDSISTYRKYLMQDTVINFKRFKQTFTISSLKNDTLLESLFTADLKNLEGVSQKHYSSGSSLEDFVDSYANAFAYFIKIKDDTTERYTLLKKQNVSAQMDSTISLLYRLTDTALMKPTSTRFNEDSIVVPIISKAGHKRFPISPEILLLPSPKN